MGDLIKAQDAATTEALAEDVAPANRREAFLAQLARGIEELEAHLAQCLAEIEDHASEATLWRGERDNTIAAIRQAKVAAGMAPAPRGTRTEAESDAE